jgi:hypothetical protein
MVWFGVFRHVESHIREDYLDVEKMDENAILMQYFKESCVMSKKHLWKNRIEFSPTLVHI